MLVDRVSPFSYKLNTMDLPITSDQVLAYLSGRALLQDAFPQLTPEQREFYKTGITPDEWEAMRA